MGTGNRAATGKLAGPSEVDKAAAWLREGELVAFPTDTVYGVGAIVWNGAAVAKLYQAKLRALDKPIPVLLADFDDLDAVTDGVSDAARRVASRLWPGPLTLVLPRARRVPLEVTAGGNSVAVRIPDHVLARSLIRAAGAPLATTSANLSGRPSSTTAAEVSEQLGDRVAMILDGGRCAGGVPSTVVDLTGESPVLLRAGPTDLHEILAAMV